MEVDPVIEQRKSKRFELKLPVEVVRKSFAPVSSVGTTKNMSAGGVLFYAPLRAEIGEPIEYIITFSKLAVNQINFRTTENCSYTSSLEII